MVNCTIENKVGIVQLNNGKVNAISHALIKELKENFIALEKNNEVDGVILYGAHGCL